MERLFLIIPCRSSHHNKNKSTVGDVPLWRIAMNYALDFRDTIRHIYNVDIIVSTNDTEILNSGIDNLVILDKRDDSISGDDALITSLLTSIYNRYGKAKYLLFQPTSPFRAHWLTKACLDSLDTNTYVFSAVSHKAFGVISNGEGYLTWNHFMKNHYTPRQKAPMVLVPDGNVFGGWLGNDNHDSNLPINTNNYVLSLQIDSYTELQLANSMYGKGIAKYIN